MSEIHLRSANWAFALGTWELGAKIASVYPGTLSTGTLEEIGFLYPENEIKWYSNEKTALNVAMGTSVGELRSLEAIVAIELIC